VKASDSLYDLWRTFSDSSSPEHDGNSGARALAAS